MLRRQILHLAFNGVMIVFLGMLAGYVYRFALTDDWGPDQQRTWRILHTFMVQTGSLYIAFAAIGPFLTISKRAGSWSVWTLVIGGYAFAGGLVVASLLDLRGLAPGDSLGSALVFLNFVISSAAGVAGVALLLRGAAASLGPAFAESRRADPAKQG